jgi:hypothetical protein
MKTKKLRPSFSFLFYLPLKTILLEHPKIENSLHWKCGVRKCVCCPNDCVLFAVQFRNAHDQILSSWFASFTITWLLAILIKEGHRRPIRSTITITITSPEGNLNVKRQTSEHEDKIHENMGHGGKCHNENGPRVF